MIYIVTYDIASDRLREKISKILVSAGYERIQYSVFVAIENPHKNQNLWKRIEKLEQNSYDEMFRLFVIPVPKDCFLSMEMLGNPGFELEYLAGNKNTLFL